jgi:hypothetical protein
VTKKVVGVFVRFSCAVKEDEEKEASYNVNICIAQIVGRNSAGRHP